MTVFQKAADVAHKAAVTGLFGISIYSASSLAVQVVDGASGPEKRHPQAGYIQMLRDKAAESYAKYYDITHREWYDKDDDSYLKQVPKPKDYQDKE